MNAVKQNLTSIIFGSIACLAVICVNGIAHAGFDSFVIRNGASGSPTIQTNNNYVSGATEFIINEGGMKAGWGSNDINGNSFDQIGRLFITRYDETGRFSAGSGPAVAPYFNIWVTDGFGNYAVIANEPSNPSFQTLFIDNGDGSKSYDLTFDDLSDTRAKVYETPGWNSNSSWVHLLFGPDPLTFADLATLEIAPPPPSYIQDPGKSVGSGAPDVIDTDIAYGFTWVFGDTMSNYVSGDEGYVVANPVAATICSIKGVIDQLQNIIDSNPYTDVADMLEDTPEDLENALEELDKPDNQAAVGIIEGVVGKIDDAVDKGLEVDEAMQLVDCLASVARSLAVDAIYFAVSLGGDRKEIREARKYLRIGDRKFAKNKYKKAVSYFKDALRYSQ